MTPVTFKQVQGNETWYELVDPKQDYNHAKFEKLQFNSVKKRELTLRFHPIRKYANFYYLHWIKSVISHT